MRVKFLPMQHSIIRRLPFTLIILLFAVTGFGCVSQKPIPFNYSAVKAATTTAPKLSVLPTENQRIRDKMDKVVVLPTGLNFVIVRELRATGLFSDVALKAPNSSETNFVLQATLKELRWEIPNYGKMVGTTTVISALTGGIGGLAYGSTGVDVHGHARVQFVLKNPRGATVLNREYFSKTTERKAKMNSDTPTAYREVAASSLKEVINQFTDDLRQLELP